LKPCRIVVLTNGNFFARVILDSLLRDRADDVAGIVVVTGIAAGRSRRQSLRKILESGGVRHFVFKASTYMIFAVSSLVLRKKSFFVHQLAKRFGIPVCFTQYVNEPRVFEQVTAWHPDILVSVSCPQRVDRSLLGVPTTVAVNVHSSLLPRYAGIEPYLWVLANGEATTGTTVHVMREDFDTGDIIVQKELEIRPRESAMSLFYRLSLLGREALTEAVDAIVADSATLARQDESRRTYFSWPTAETVAAVYRNGHRLVRISDYRAPLVDTR
jgi:folate-dependent phosphoribosylglycinamide formyltransferase PurN